MKLSNTLVAASAALALSPGALARSVPRDLDLSGTLNRTTISPDERLALLFEPIKIAFADEASRDSFSEEILFDTVLRLLNASVDALDNGSEKVWGAPAFVHHFIDAAIQIMPQTQGEVEALASTIGLAAELRERKGSVKSERAVESIEETFFDTWRLLFGGEIDIDAKWWPHHALHAVEVADLYNQAYALNDRKKAVALIKQDIDRGHHTAIQLIQASHTILELYFVTELWTLAEVEKKVLLRWPRFNLPGKTETERSEQLRTLALQFTAAQQANSANLRAECRFQLATPAKGKPVDLAALGFANANDDDASESMDKLELLDSFYHFLTRLQLEFTPSASARKNDLELCESSAPFRQSSSAKGPATSLLAKVAFQHACSDVSLHGLRYIAVRPYLYSQVLLGPYPPPTAIAASNMTNRLVRSITQDEAYAPCLSTLFDRAVGEVLAEMS